MPIARGGGKDVAHTHTMEYYSAVKKNAVMPFVATWMDLGCSLMSHWVKSVRRRRRNTSWHPLYVESKKKWYNWSYRVETHRLGEWTGGCWGWGERMGEGIVREFGINMYTLLYMKWRTHKDLLSGIGNSAQCYVAAWMGGEFGAGWIHVCGWLSPFAAHLKLYQHC